MSKQNRRYTTVKNVKATPTVPISFNKYIYLGIDFPLNALTSNTKNTNAINPIITFESIVKNLNIAIPEIVNISSGSINLNPENINIAPKTDNINIIKFNIIDIFNFIILPLISFIKLYHIL